MTDYSGPERRQAALTEDKVTLMIQEAVSKALATHEQHLTAHMDKQFAALRQTFAEAFPGGDPHGHRIAHEKAIKNATAWDKMKAEVLSKFLTAGLWVAAGWLAFAVWESFKESLKR